MECKHTNLKKSCDGLIIFCQDCRVNLSKDIDFDKIVSLEVKPIINTHQTIWANDPIEKVLDTQYFDLAKQHLNRVHELEDENKLLKSQLVEIHQANVRLNNKVLELERDNKELKTKEHELKVLKFQDSFNRRVVESITNENVSLKEQLEVKEILNQDLAKKYQILQEEIDAYDINMLELVEDYKKLEQEKENLIKTHESEMCTKAYRLGAIIINTLNQVENLNDFNIIFNVDKNEILSLELKNKVRSEGFYRGIYIKI